MCSRDTQIVLSPDVPVNLLGRDMLADLWIAVVPVRDGLRARRCANGFRTDLSSPLLNRSSIFPSTPVSVRVWILFSLTPLSHIRS
ncbi:hypothetical protein SRHO_G00200140 [Serrasalmus rhombeus]